MTPKEISRRATAIFRNAVPPCWALRDQQDQEDYGVDWEVELTRPDDTASGFIFKVQQKGELRLAADARHVKLSGLAIKKLRYYLALRVPVAVVAVDVTTGLVYWTVLHGDPSVRDAIERAEQQGHASTTIRLPAGNVLPRTADALVDAVAGAVDFLVLREVAEIRPERLVRAAREQMDLDEFVDAMRRRADVLRCEQIERLLEQGRGSQARDTANQILDAGSETVPLRFAAGLYVVKAETWLAVQSPTGDRDAQILRARFGVAARLLRLVRPERRDVRLRLYARFLARTARMRQAIEADYALFSSELAQTGASDPLTALTRGLTRVRRGQAAMEVLAELRRLQRLVDRLVDVGHLDLLPQTWATLVQDLSLFVTRLRTERLDPAPIVAWLDGLGDVAHEVARHTERWDEVGLIAVQQVTLASQDADDQQRRFSRARGMLSQIPDRGRAERERALAHLDRLERDLASLPQSLSYDEETVLIERMARSAGIDLDDPRDRIAQIVRIGLRDRNPERVLRNCQHLLVQISSFGLPARMLGLPQAGSKTLSCTKHGYQIGGVSLDDVYATLERFHCSRCPDRTAHGPEWSWSPDWQSTQERRHSGEPAGSGPTAGAG